MIAAASSSTRARNYEFDILPWKQEFTFTKL